MMDDELFQDLTNLYAGRFQEQERMGTFLDPDVLEFMQELLTPKEYYDNGDFQGFTEDQMRLMVYDPFGEGCPVKLRNLTEEEIEKIPFMRQTLHLMNSLNKKELKLTPKGNLPVKMVSELYELGAQSVLSTYYASKTEDNIFEVKLFRAVLNTMGLIKVRSGKMSLTAKGKKLLSADHNKLLRAIIMFFFTDYNTACCDNMGSNRVGDLGRPYSLWMLHHYGEDWCSMRFLTDEYYKAFPRLDKEDTTIVKLYKYRVFFRLFRIIGLAEINENIHYGADNWQDEVRKTPVLDMMFSFEEPEKI